MKTLITFLLAICFPVTVMAQDARGRERQPPPKNEGRGNSGNSGRSSDPGNSRDSGSSNNSGNSGRSRDSGNSGRSDNSSNSGGYSRDSGATRRTAPVGAGVPIEQRPGTGTQDALRGRGREPQPPALGPKGEPLGHAVRRDSLPPSERGVIGGLGDPRRYDGDEHERGRHYWHEYQGHRYSHYIDPYGDDWYYWYYGNDYYSMRYYDGRWWRYDAFRDRWCYLYGNYWYYEEGDRNYVYDDDSQDYEDVTPLTAPQMSATLHVGSFSPSITRNVDDVIARDAGFLKFDQNELDGVFVGGEVTAGVGNYVEVGVDAGYYKGTANSNYTDYVRPDGSEIKQQLSLSMVPVTLAAKVFPFGRDTQIQPYIGGGVGINMWQYQEKGDFIDFASDGFPIYNETYTAKGTAVNTEIIAGMRIPVNNKVMIGCEYRYQFGRGALPKDGGFAGSKIDLSGSMLQLGVSVNLNP